MPRSMVRVNWPPKCCRNSSKPRNSVSVSCRLGRLQRNAQPLQAVQHAIGVLAGQAVDQRRVHGIHRHPDRHRFAVPQLEPAHALQLVGRPMPEVQRAGFEHLERIAALGDVLQVQQGRAADEGQRRGHIAVPNPFGRLAQVVEQRPVLQQRDFHRFGEPAEKIAIAQRLQQLCVVDHRPGRRKTAQPILLLKQVDAVLDADARIALGQRRSRQPDKPQPAMRDRGGKTDRVQDRAAADDHDVAAPIQIRGVKDLQHPLQQLDVVLDLLAAGNDLNAASRLNPLAMPGEKLLDLGPQRRIGGIHVGIDPELDASRTGAGRLQHVRQDLLVGAKNVLRKAQPMDQRHVERAVDDVHTRFGAEESGKSRFLLL